MRLGFLVLSLAAVSACSGGWMIYRANQVQTNDVGLDFSQPRHYVTDQMEVETRAMGNRLEPSVIKTSDRGMPVKIASPHEKQPQFILFIKDDCPCSIDAQPIFNKLAERYQSKVEFVGVIDGGPDKAKKFASEFSAAFPVVGDADLSLIHGFGATAGVYSALVARNGHLIKMWPGYSADLLKDMNHTLARAAATPETPFDPEYAPTKKTTGCAYATNWSAG